MNYSLVDGDPAGVYTLDPYSGDGDPDEVFALDHVSGDLTLSGIVFLNSSAVAQYNATVAAVDATDKVMRSPAPPRIGSSGEKHGGRTGSTRCASAMSQT